MRLVEFHEEPVFLCRLVENPDTKYSTDVACEQALLGVGGGRGKESLHGWYLKFKKKMSHAKTWDCYMEHFFGKIRLD